MYNVIAFQIADHIDIKEVKKSYAGTAMHSDLSEVLYGDKDNKYFYVLAYGVVVFVGYDEAEISKLIEFISPYCKNILKEKACCNCIISLFYLVPCLVETSICRVGCAVAAFLIQYLFLSKTCFGWF